MVDWSPLTSPHKRPVSPSLFFGGFSLLVIAFATSRNVMLGMVGMMIGPRQQQQPLSRRAHPRSTPENNTRSQGTGRGLRTPLLSDRRDGGDHGGYNSSRRRCGGQFRCLSGYTLLNLFSVLPRAVCPFLAIYACYGSIDSAFEDMPLTSLPSNGNGLHATGGGDLLAGMLVGDGGNENGGGGWVANYLPGAQPRFEFIWLAALISGALCVSLWGANALRPHPYHLELHDACTATTPPMNPRVCPGRVRRGVRDASGEWAPSAASVVEEASGLQVQPVQTVF
jgi:hypothetical protein